MNSGEIFRSTLALPLAAVLAFGLTPLVRRLSLRHGIVDLPGHRKIHRQPTALLGGLAVFAAVAGTAFLLHAVNRPVFILLLGGAAMLAIGLADDAYDIGASKFAAELILAALVVAAAETERAALAAARDDVRSDRHVEVRRAGLAGEPDGKRPGIDTVDGEPDGATVRRRYHRRRQLLCGRERETGAD